MSSAGAHGENIIDPSIKGQSNSASSWNSTSFQ